MPRSLGLRYLGQHAGSIATTHLFDIPGLPIESGAAAYAVERALLAVPTDVDIWAPDAVFAVGSRRFVIAWGAGSEMIEVASA